MDNAGLTRSANKKRSRQSPNNRGVSILLTQLVYRKGATMTGTIRVGIGGWTYEPWRGVFYPAGLSQKRELEFASRAVNTIEINGTYYSTFKPDSWRKWRDETPDGFVFAIKGSRFCTNRKVLATAG